MSQLSNITPSGNRPWLKSVYEQRKERSIQLGIQAIDALVADETPVTLKNIQEKSKELDSNGKGIHSNTIKKNEELHSYYKQHSKTFKVRQKKKKPLLDTTLDESYIRNLSPDRNLSNVRTKYMKMTKEELVNKLIQTEQYVALNQNKWVANHFERFK
ncbi:hypothetical protein [Pseudobacillus badius]|uniref:hypothetical protein n=1 Tax=Bacillus badius TaxID=1455 RepID=UPI0007B3EA45|nr:hypothetical protein [Bacillus badius]KZR59357.1 hypothetical protein A3781_13225 [Bacillus badius]